MHITGWIRNLPTKEVAAELHGYQKDIDRLLGWLQDESGFDLESVDKEEFQTGRYPKYFIIAG